jgi:hypothetical protein
MMIEQIAIAAGIGIIAMISIVLAIIGLKKSDQLREQLRQLEQQNESLKKQVVMQSEELHEVRSGALAVGNKVKDLMVKFDLLSDKVQEVEYLDPETRLYAQAAKMVEAGASVDELMQECDLPRAEAELLLSVKKTT